MAVGQKKDTQKNILAKEKWTYSGVLRGFLLDMNSRDKHRENETKMA